MTSKIGIAIFSQSHAVAKGTADIVRDLVGNEIPCVHCGRSASGSLKDMIVGMQEALNDLHKVTGIVVLVDVGATEIAAETAIAALPHAIRQRVRICDAPIVEGAIIIGIEAIRGASLAEVCSRAEILSRMRDPLPC